MTLETLCRSEVKIITQCCHSAWQDFGGEHQHAICVLSLLHVCGDLWKFVVVLVEFCGDLWMFVDVQGRS